jgi:hypothetical protein
MFTDAKNVGNHKMSGRKLTANADGFAKKPNEKEIFNQQKII